MKTTQCERCGDDVYYGWSIMEGIIFPIPVYERKLKYCHDCQLHLDIIGHRANEVIRQQKIAEWEKKNSVVNQAQQGQVRE